MFNFKLYSLLESILTVDSQFDKIINNLKGNDDIASHLSDIIQTDIKTNLNYLKPSDNNQDIFFVNDSQVQRIIDKGENPFNKAVNRTKIGRAVQQILKDNQIEVNPTDIEKFTNNYKNMYDQVVLGKFPEDDIEIVSSGMIGFWYDENNYVSGGGTLNNSCMRYDECQDYFGIYENNPAVCQLIILTDKAKKLAGRALLWKLDDGSFYLDRIYTRYDHQVDSIYNYFKKLHPEGKSHHMEDYGNISVNLKNWQYKLYPYMDSFYFLGYENGILTNDDGIFKGEIYFKLRSTEGDPTVYGGVWSERLDKYINNQIAVDIGDDDYVTQDMCKWSDYEDAYVYEDDAIQTEKWGILNRNNCIRFEKDGDEYWVPNDQAIDVYINGQIKLEIQDDFDTTGYIKAFYRSSKYNTKSVWAQEEDCITILDDNFKKFVKNDLISSYIKDGELIKLDKINENIKVLLAKDPYLPVIGGQRESISFIPVEYKDIFLTSETSSNYIGYELYYTTIFLNRNIIVTDVLSNYPAKFHSELMKVHQYLIDEYGEYGRMIRERDFKKDLNESSKTVIGWLENSKIKEDLFAISQLVPESYWGNKIPEELGKKFNKGEYQEFKDLYQRTYDIDNIEDQKLQSEILPRYLEAWKRLTFYMYLTKSYNRDGYIDHLSEQKIIESRDRRLILSLTYDDFKIGEELYQNKNIPFGKIPRQDQDILRYLDFNTVDQLFDLYMKKEGF